MFGSILVGLVIRIIVIITAIDSLMFYVIVHRYKKITLSFAGAVIILTICVLVINVWFELWRYGVKY